MRERMPSARCQSHAIDLDDRAVDLVRQAVALLAERGVELERLLDAGAALDVPLDVKAPRAQRLEHLVLRGEGRRLDVHHLVRVEVELA